MSTGATTGTSLIKAQAQARGAVGMSTGDYSPFGDGKKAQVVAQGCGPAMAQGCGEGRKIPGGTIAILNTLTAEAAKSNATGMLAPITSQRPAGAWEVLEAIVDSGATVPVINPKMAKAYPLMESEASRLGVEYETANGDKFANLGKKRFAVMTKEGTLRGYETESADVSKCLNAVRSMVAGKSAVCFGLGPDGDQHLIINRLTGEINAMEDDGVNYIQKLWVVPEDEIGKVQEAMMMAQDFPGPGN